MTDFSSFQSFSWLPSYKTSVPGPSGKPVDILHDFYIPILSMATRYDRVAGYFRSTSLAIASQGFSAFTAVGGKMRLVVGADLAEDDVAAILQGDNERLEKSLNAALEGADSWPEEVTRGVQLLAWMVSRGHLEVQVAFRVHGKTGRQLPFDSISDGYVHEKWAVFSDSEGNCIHISGSLNESRTALTLNAENITLHADWWNDLERQRADEAQQDFDRVWADKSPYLRVMSLPDAVRRKLISYAEGIILPAEVDGSSDMQPEHEPPSARERLQFALIKDGPRLPGGRFVGMETAPVSPWPHQEVVARRLIATWPYSYLLCDEVGLGKTIEAGLAIRSLVLSGLVERVLIAPPASLTKQWQREMASKFLLPFDRALSGAGVRHERIFPEPETASGKNLYSPDLCIVSTGLLAHKQRRQDLDAARRFDIALVDEAHYARRQNPAAAENRRADPRFGRLYTTIRDGLRKRSESLWLATATPMQLDWIEVYDLIHLTNRVGAFQNDPTLTWGYYDLLGRLVRGQPVSQQEWEFLRQVVRSIEYHDPFLKQYIDTAVIDGRIRGAARQFLEQGRIPRGRDLVNIRRLIFSAAPLSRVMLRHTRSLLEIYKERGQLQARLARRTIHPIPRIVFTALEQKAYDELEAFCTGLAQQIQQHGDEQFSQNNLKFLLSLLRLRFASSLFAIRETIRRRRERVIATLEYQSNAANSDPDDIVVEFSDDEEGDRKVLDSLLKNRSKKDLQWEKKHLASLLETLQDLTERPSKIQALLDTLQSRQLSGGRLRQTVIFTRFYDTLTDIVARLRTLDPSMLIGTYSGRGGQYVDPATGRLCSVDREEIKHRFLREEIDVLICTDAAAEGLNLQTADLLINFDLPWNPMKVEQRIGRIDRIGQKYDDIYVLNLCYVGSVEETVYGRLLQRLAQAGGVVGTQQVSMLPVSEDDFQKLAMGELNEEELEQLALERIERQQERTASMEIPATDLYDIYMRMAQEHAGQKLPVTLGMIWDVLCTSEYLHRVGCTVSQDGRIMTVNGIQGVPDNTLLTADRELFDKGLPGEDRALHFSSWGDPVFDAILVEIEQYGLPECVSRIRTKISGLQAEMVAYAVVTTGEDGKSEVQLVTSLEQAATETLNLETKIDEPRLAGEKQLLQNIAHKEFSSVQAAAAIERDNIQSACSQHLLSLVTMFALLNNFDVSEQENFRATVKILDKSIDKKTTLGLHNLWADPLRPFAGSFLFDVKIPQIGEQASVQAPHLLALSAVDTGYRVAHSMRKKMSELTVGNVLDRLEREI